MDREARYYAAIIGAGPAGLFAARQLADHNIHTVLFNRDIKPGGLAEYGIYPTKTRMKEGLQKPIPPDFWNWKKLNIMATFW